MSTDMDFELRNALVSFGLTQNEQEIYVILVKSSWTTVLGLARKSTIKRTTLYNILENMVKRGLVEVKIDDKTTYYRAGGLDSFQQLADKQSRKINEMQKSIDVLRAKLPCFVVQNELFTDVRFYRGGRGIESVEWRLSQDHNGESLIFATHQWSKFLDKNFVKKIREERLINNVRIKELVNSAKFSKISQSGLAKWSDNRKYLLKIYRHRMISESVLPIKNEVIIHGGAIFFYSFEQGDVVCIEVKNAAYAELMRCLFKEMWKKAKILDGFGN